MSITKEVKEVFRSQGLRGAFLYNNRLLFSKIITPEQYDFNHAFLTDLRILKKGL